LSWLYNIHSNVHRVTQLITEIVFLHTHFEQSQTEISFCSIWLCSNTRLNRPKPSRPNAEQRVTENKLLKLKWAVTKYQEIWYDTPTEEADEWLGGIPELESSTWTESCQTCGERSMEYRYQCPSCCISINNNYLCKYWFHNDMHFCVL